jgi:curved DNA-binding protein CbpA
MPPVVDHFAQLNVPRRAALDPELIKQRFLALSAENHPDKAADKASAEAGFQRINEAYNVLRNTRLRLLHLLELEGAATRTQPGALPPAALEMFEAVATATNRADALLKAKALESSPMLRVRFFEKALDCVEALQQVQREIRKRSDVLEQQLPEMDARRDFVEMHRAATALAYFDRWQAQLQERSAELTF